MDACSVPFHSSRCITLHLIALHGIALHYVAYTVYTAYMKLYSITIRYRALPYLTLRCLTQHCVTLHALHTLHTLHMHACMQACIHTYMHTYRTYVHVDNIHACTHTVMHARMHDSMIRRASRKGVLPLSGKYCLAWLRLDNSKTSGLSTQCRTLAVGLPAGKFCVYLAFVLKFQRKLVWLKGHVHHCSMVLSHE